MPKVPEYRVRLFLSVDLTGSTAFKHKNHNPLEWIKVFQRFYKTFPSNVKFKYVSLCDTTPYLDPTEVADGAPKLWKTIGDEIIFTCRVTSLCHLSCAFRAFIETLNEFGNEIKNNYPDLNTKGNAWVASFPTPNVSLKPLRMERKQGEAPGDALTGDNEITSEEMEKEVDETPHLFDFLGKGIDAGFRISKNSEINKLTASPGLAILLCEAAESQITTGFTSNIRLDEMQSFKGVANGFPYPVLTIDTFRDQDHQDLMMLQREILSIPMNFDHKKLKRYLTSYMKHHEIEISEVNLHYGKGKSEPPEFYQKYRARWQQELENEQSNYDDLGKRNLDSGASDKILEIPDAINVE